MPGSQLAEIFPKELFCLESFPLCTFIFFTKVHKNLPKEKDINSENHLK